MGSADAIPGVSEYVGGVNLKKAVEHHSFVFPFTEHAVFPIQRSEKMEVSVQTWEMDASEGCPYEQV